MKLFKASGVAMLLFAVVATSATAQDGTRRVQQGRGPGMMGARALIEQGSVGFLASKKDDLKADDALIAKLNEIEKTFAAKTADDRAKLKEGLPQPGQGMNAGGDRDAMRDRMQALRPMMDAVTAADEEAKKEAMALLSDEQKKTAESLLQARMEALRPRRG